MRSPCCLCVCVSSLTPESLNSGAREDGRYNTICDMTSESRKSSVREAPAETAISRQRLRN
jgi:hypothetical protein